MRRKTMCGFATLLITAAFLVGRATAQEGEHKMPAWTQKTKEHEALKKHVGEWDVVTKWWQDPTAAPNEGKATTKANLILGGLFLEESFKSDWMGQPFEGRFILGYDTIDKEYVGIWLDTFSPIMSISRGAEKDGVVTKSGMNPDWQTDKKVKSWTKQHWVNDDQFVLRFFKNGPDGKEFKSGEFVYTRKK